MDAWRLKVRQHAEAHFGYWPITKEEIPTATIRKIQIMIRRDSMAGQTLNAALDENYEIQGWRELAFAFPDRVGLLAGPDPMETPGVFLVTYGIRDGKGPLFQLPVLELAVNNEGTAVIPKRLTCPNCQLKLRDGCDHDEVAMGTPVSRITFMRSKRWLEDDVPDMMELS